MSYDRYRVSVEVLENGFSIEIPDFEEMAKKKEAAAKAAKTNKGMCAAEPYLGDCTKKYAAKSVAEVLKLVKGSLEKMPEAEYDVAFKEAAKDT